MSSIIDIHDLGQIGMLVGIAAGMMGLFAQIRSWRKDQKAQQEYVRTSITTEINAKSETLFTTIETKLEAIKVAALVGKEDITLLKVQLIELQSYVNELDKEGTVEWKATKPFILAKIDSVAQRISELEDRWNKKI